MGKNYTNYNKPQQYQKQIVEVEEKTTEFVEPTYMDTIESVEDISDTKEKHLNEVIIKHVTNCARVNVRSNNSTTADVIDILESGAEVQVEYELSGFAYVIYDMHKTGWIMTDYLESSDKNAK